MAFTLLAAVIAALVLSILPSGLPSLGDYGEGEGNDSAKPPRQPDTTAQLALDGAIASAVLLSFDDTGSARDRAQAKTIRNLRAIESDMARSITPQARRAADEMMSLSFASRLGWASGRDYWDDQDRVWSLFDQALGAENEQTLERTDAAFTGQKTSFRRELHRDQSRYWSRLKSQGAARSLSVSVPQIRSTVPVDKPNRLIFDQVARRLKARFPGLIRQASTKLGAKELAKAPGAALDGPVPIIDTALVIWGLYDIGSEATTLWETAKNEVAGAIVSKVSQMIGERHALTRAEIFGMEKWAAGARCQMLQEALGGLQFPAKNAEIEKRCAPG